MFHHDDKQIESFELKWLEYLPYPTLLYDHEGIFLQCNMRANTLLDQEHDYCRGKRLPNNEFSRESDKALSKTVKELIIQVKKNKVDKSQLLQLKDGSFYEVLCTTVTDCDVNDKGGFLVTLMDITKHVEEAQKWKINSKLFQSIIDHSPSLVVVVDENKKILRMNPAFQNVFSIGDSYIGTDLSSIELFKSTQLNRYIEKGLKGTTTSGAEETIKLSNGDLYSASLTVSPVEYEDLEYNAVGIIMHDITIKKAFESELKETEHLLRYSKQLAMVGQLAAGVAHEIRNPLTVLKGFIQILHEDNKNIPHIDVIINELDHLELITNEFLALAKPQAVHFYSHSLKDMITASANFIKMECIKLNVELYLNIQEEMLVMCDVHQIKQVFLNLLKNALDAMPNGGKLVISSRKNKQTAEITIEDTGIGISPERFIHLGEPFYSTKEKGTGLGLMVCQKIIKEHHGLIKIESKVGIGTKVVISLPLIKNG